MLLRSICGNRRFAQVVAVRFLGPAYFQRGGSNLPVAVDEKRKELELLLKDDLPKPYDGPERDLINFPRRQREIEPGKLRMGFLPEEWFQFFYKKTGVTGPYVFGFGLITFLFSKELYVFEEEFSTGMVIFGLAYVTIKKFGSATKDFSQKLVKDEEAELERQKGVHLKGLNDMIADEKKSVWQAQGQKILMNAKRENIAMQLEAEYRRRAMNVYEEVKKRLDYQLDIYNTRRKLEQKHMVDWIVNNVVKSITPQQEKEALQKCIEDLKVLSARG